MVNSTDSVVNAYIQVTETELENEAVREEPALNHQTSEAGAPAAAEGKQVSHAVGGGAACTAHLQQEGDTFSNQLIKPHKRPSGRSKGANTERRMIPDPPTTKPRQGRGCCSSFGCCF